MEERLFDTVEAAAFLGLSRTTVSHFVLNGDLPSQKYGRARLIKESDLIAFKDVERKPGRPPKRKADGESAGNEGAATAAEQPTKKAKAKAVDQTKAAKLHNAALVSWKREPSKATKKSKK